MNDITIRRVDEVSFRIITSPAILQELKQEFTFKTDNYKFSPQYRSKVWNGDICLIKRDRLYIGLLPRLIEIVKRQQYSIEIENNLHCKHNISLHEFQQFYRQLGLPFEPRDYQIESTIGAIRSKRQVVLSPTSSGKSLIIYLFIRWCLQFEQKALVIVPSIGLVGQMRDDFEKYGNTLSVHCSTDSLDKSDSIQADIVITTWQSINNGKTSVPLSWYKQFGVVVADECHAVNQSSKVKIMIQILSSLVNTKWRLGTTGTLNDNQLNQYTLEGLLGPISQLVNTKDLMDKGHVSNLSIKCIVLSYPESVRKHVKTLSYNEEIDFIVSHTQRNNFIKNLALSLVGNVLVFFRLVEKHGNVIRDLLLKDSSKTVLYIDGSVSGEERQQIREQLEQSSNSILVASLGTTSTGVSITTLKHMIAASPSKSKIKVLQSIGRLLRLHVDKQEAILYDIVDDFSIGSYQNYTLRHFQERLKIYNQEKFPYKIYTVEIKS